MRSTNTSLFRLWAAALLSLGGVAAHAQTPTYQKVWGDEFNGSIGPAWNLRTGPGPATNNEQEYYQPANVTVNATDLLITARKESVGGFAYTSGRLDTKDLKSFTYGKIEARIKMPTSTGMWPAFWMLGANYQQPGYTWPGCGEIDIMEHLNGSSTIYSTQHWLNGTTQASEQRTTTTATPGDYHVYTVEWTPTAISTSMDGGTPYHVMDITNSVNGTDEFQKPFFLLLNLAVGGDWPGHVIDESALPATMFVDWVRVYQLQYPIIQAESYNAMSGVQLENCTDTGGGQDVGYIDTNDWMSYYNLKFPTSGTYRVEYRVASPNGGQLSCDLNAGSTQLGSLAVPATGGWQNWTTISHTVTVNAGTYNFGVFARAGGWNINWLRISKVTARPALAAAPAAAQAKPFAASLYPNPQRSGAPVRLELSNYDFTEPAEVLVTDLKGSVVLRKTVTQSLVDLNPGEALKPGHYLVRVAGSRGRVVSRLVVE